MKKDQVCVPGPVQANSMLCTRSAVPLFILPQALLCSSQPLLQLQGKPGGVRQVAALLLFLGPLSVVLWSAVKRWASIRLYGYHPYITLSRINSIFLAVSGWCSIVSQWGLVESGARASLTVVVYQFWCEKWQGRLRLRRWMMRRTWAMFLTLTLAACYVCKIGENCLSGCRWTVFG